MKEKGKGYRSSAIDRVVHSYLKPGAFSIFNAYANVNEMSKSEAMNVIVQDFFGRMSIEEKQKLLNKSKNSY